MPNRRMLTLSRVTFYRAAYRAQICHRASSSRWPLRWSMLRLTAGSGSTKYHGYRAKLFSARLNVGVGSTLGGMGRKTLLLPLQTAQRPARP